jgi:hypothetical protein
MNSNRLIVKWNLRRVIADLAVHLETLERADDLQSTCNRSDEFLEPYSLPASDFEYVVRMATGNDCTDCGRLFDHYMVYDAVWQQAGLGPPP